MSYSLLKVKAYISNVLGGRDPAYYARYTLAREARLVGALGKMNRQSSRVLDIGCGYACPGTAILAAQGWQVTGVDIIDTFIKHGFLAHLKATVSNYGVVRGVIQSPIVYCQERRKLRKIGKIINRPIRFKAIPVGSYDGRSLGFGDHSFDAVVSQDVLEHVQDVAGFWQEVTRVLKPGGVVDMIYHNFYSPSGAHAPVYPPDPWGHVTASIPLTRHAALNKLLPSDQIKAAQNAGIEVLQVKKVDFNGNLMDDGSEFEFEGADWLAEHGRKAMALVEGRIRGVETLNQFGISLNDILCVSRFLITGKK